MRATPDMARRTLRPGRRGASAIEFAIVAPVIIVALLGLADIGLYFHRSILLEEAARSAGAYAQAFPTDTAGIRTIVNANAANLAAGDVTVTCLCGSDPVTCSSFICTDTEAERRVEIGARQVHDGFMFVRGIELRGNAIVRLP